MGKNLRSTILRLAAKQPELQDDLVPLLERHGGLSLSERYVLQASRDPDARKRLLATGNTSVVQQPPIIIQQPPVIVQQDVGIPQAPVPAPAPVMAPPPPPPPAPSPPVVVEPAMPGAPVGAMFVTEMTRKGFEADLLPQLNRMHAEGMPRDQAGQVILQMIDEAFKRKDALYNILIRHQSTFQGDEDYRASLESLVQAWVADTADNGG